MSRSASARAALLVVAALLALALPGCSSDESAPSAPSAGASGSPTGSDVYDDNLSHHPTTYGTPGPGYPDPADPPAPAATFTPSPDAWAGVHAPSGFTVTMVAAADDPQAATMVEAVRAWADEESVDLSVTMVAGPADNVGDLADAINAEPDLIVTSGDSLVDAVALVTASAPDRRFLILGGEIAEPTFNVTAVDWAGAGFRGEGLGLPASHDEASFTAERGGRAIRAGVAAVLTNWSGLVVWVG
jgi:hypothetical protein